MTVLLGPETVDKLFEFCTHQGEVLEGLYRIAFPDWDRISSIKGYPVVNKATWKEIAKRFMAFDRRFHPDCLAGGAWLNTGFSAFDGEELADWEVSLDQCKVEYTVALKNDLHALQTATT